MVRVGLNIFSGEWLWLLAHRKYQCSAIPIVRGHALA